MKHFVFLLTLATIITSCSVVKHLEKKTVQVKRDSTATSHVQIVSKTTEHIDTTVTLKADTFHFTPAIFTKGPAVDSIVTPELKMVVKQDSQGHISITTIEQKRQVGVMLQKSTITTTTESDEVKKTVVVRQKDRAVQTTKKFNWIWLLVALLVLVVVVRLLYIYLKLNHKFL